MHDAGKILFGLFIFLALVTFPIWFTAASGQTGHRPELEKPAGEKRCIEDTAFMRDWHMDLIDTWRDDVVRKGLRTYQAKDGTEYEMSLSMTCMRCHANKEKFCDRCHLYIGVEPYCWECHVAPRGD